MGLPLLILLFACPLFSQQAPANDSISRDQLKADLYFLAGDAMRGRLTGTREYELAAQFLASRLERLGVQKLPTLKNYFHEFDLVYTRLDRDNALTLAGSREAKLMEEFYPHNFSASREVEAAVVFSGYGVRAPKLNWDDYQDVRGKIVLILDGDPEPNNPKSKFDGVVSSEPGGSLRKAIAAQDSGAAGVLIVNANPTANFLTQGQTVWPEKPAHLQRYTLASDYDRIRIPVAQIAAPLAEQLLSSTGKKLQDLRAQAEREPWKTALDLGTKVRIRTALSGSRIHDRTVVGMVDGSDPQLKQEAVIVSAHYDHNGATTEIFNGADDNGSGVVGLLEIAEAYAIASKQGQRPKRSVMFVFWGSEERCCGPLLGAWAWIEKPGWPLDRTVAVLNMDMIGRSEEVPQTGPPRFTGLPKQTAVSNSQNVNLLGYSYSPELSKAVDASNTRFDLTLLRRYDNNRSNLLRRSDHWPFLQTGIPAVWFHTGLHPDYHTRNDRPENIDYVKMERIARLVHQASWDLANAGTRPGMLPTRGIPEETKP